MKWNDVLGTVLMCIACWWNGHTLGFKKGQRTSQEGQPK